MDPGSPWQRLEERLSGLEPASPWNVVATFVVGWAFYAAFPRLGYRLRWVSRLGPRGLAAYVVWRTAHVYAVHASAHRLRDWTLEAQAIEDQLGRKMTPDERWDVQRRRKEQRMGRPMTPEERGEFDRMRLPYPPASTGS